MLLRVVVSCEPKDLQERKLAEIRLCETRDRHRDMVSFGAEGNADKGNGSVPKLRLLLRPVRQSVQLQVLLIAMTEETSYPDGRIEI